jgi:hypothetical protein
VFAYDPSFVDSVDKDRFTTFLALKCDWRVKQNMLTVGMELCNTWFSSEIDRLVLNIMEVCV